ncbi:hypothetical protein JY651_30080 [Pyxidicoccus parkwayensis]|uniref:Porin n=1 Tax=Pyxidicoccus parkwayensis TaxID=2813578 RepID=A0ABX7NLB6_9BACT|nr:hypothetical protein [Pyxidicoccus parkwaysis]QSQ19550.1 hypothetical protein JY651_30080 [Pyxidicoccus parkwaysis]
MHVPPLPVRTAVLLCIVCGSTATAEPWKGARPGTTTERQVVRLLGEPTRRGDEGQELVLVYEDAQAPEGTRRAELHLTPKTRRLRRIDLEPDTAPTREAIEQKYGPECGPGRAGKPCYQVRVTPDSEPYFHYAWRGLAVFFSGGEVRALTYLPPARSRRSAALPVPPPPWLKESPASSVAPTEGPKEEAAPAVATPDPGAMDLAVASIVDETGGAAGAAAAEELTVPTIVEASGKPITASGSTPGADAESDEGPQPLSQPEVLDENSFDVQHDPLTVGGIYYQRAELYGASRASEAGTALQPNFPALLDIYLDAKPVDGLRGFAVGRLLYDPVDPALSTPKTSLDKLWLYFGLADRVFFTIGRQHVRWGSNKVWTPTNFLRDPNPDPLDAYDLRPGVDMLKINIPWESLASNLWLVGTANLDSAATNPSGIQYGGAVRAEVALGTSELIATAHFREARRPRFGLDYSLGVGRFDFNAEVAVLQDSDTRVWERSGDTFVERSIDGPQIQAAGGIQAQFRVADVYRTVVRLEGLYNQLGTTDRKLLTWEQSTGDFQPLYFGRLYGMAQIAVTARNVYEPTFALTVLGNVSDPSFLARLDVNGSRLRDVVVAAFVEMPFGERGGEFRFQPDPTVADLPATDLGLFRVGINLRLRL